MEQMAQGDAADDDLKARIDQLEVEIQRIFGTLGSIAPASDHIAGGVQQRTSMMAPAAVTAPSAIAAERAPAAHIGFSGLATTSDGRPLGFDKGRARFVRLRIRQRRQRERHFPADMFADPAWDMMLDLYAAHYERRDVSVSSLCIASAVPATTALRWIKHVVDAGYFERFADPHDGRRIFVRLSEASRRSLDDYFDDLES